jgi:signal recognition particle subunit SRP54
MKSMAGQGIGGRLQAIRELQQSGMLDPGSTRLPRTKGSTGKTLTPKERMRLKKQREKEQRRKRRTERGQ